MATLLPLAASEESEVYRYLYETAEGLRQKTAAIENLVSLKDAETAPVIALALEELIRTQNTYTTASDRELYYRAVRLVADALGEYKYLDAAPFLWDAAQQGSDPLARAAALVALGRMRALDFAERVALLLDNLNLNVNSDKDAAEKLAYGAIISLEKLKDPRGFAPVFFAVDGWYSVRVRQQAERSLPNIVADPTDIIVGLIDTELPPRKVLALKFSLLSKAPAERKTVAAVAALRIGHLKAPVDKTEAKILSDLRKLALRTLIQFKGKDPAVVDGGVASYENGFDDEERLLGLSALGANGSDAAATALRDILLRINGEVRSGVADETRTRMAKEAIAAGATAKNRIVKPALLAIAANDKWSGSVILAAQLANKEIP
jgi:hypothetical protein